MDRIILQPTGDETKQDFIEKKYPSFAERDTDKYRDIWEESEGDIVLFIKLKNIFAIAKIEKIEEDYTTSQQYPLRYYWSDIQYVDIPLNKFNEAVGYKTSFYPRNYMLLEGESWEDGFNFLTSLTSKVYDENEDSLYQKDIQNIKKGKKVDDKPDRKKDLLSKNGSNYYPRNLVFAKYAIEQADYQCELNKNHITFNTKATNQNYVEAHHLIPLSFHEEFNYSLDIPANIIALCPNCHRMLHLGNKETVNSALASLYGRRKTRLKKVELDIELEELIDIYRMEAND